MSEAVTIAVTGAAGQIGYALLPRIATGAITGSDRPVILKLLEIPPALKALEGVRMEIDDLGSPLVEKIVCTSDTEEAFGDADIAFLVGSKPRGKGMERKDLIRENGPIFTGQGQALGKVAKRSVKVLVVGNPCNTNCLIAMHNAGGLGPENFAAMTRLDHNRAIAQLAGKAGVTNGKVSRVTIWGNHSATQYPDFVHARIDGKPATEVITDREWLEGDFISTVQQRGKAIIEARGLSSAMSAASAAIDHMRDWHSRTAGDDWVSAAIHSDGSYGVPEGLISSFPVRYDGEGRAQVVTDLELCDYCQGKLKTTVDELTQERDTVKDLLG